MILGRHSRRSGVLGRDTAATVMLVRGGAEVASWPLRWQRRPAVAVVDELARLQLLARRLGCSIHLSQASAELVELVDLLGLGDVLAVVASGKRSGLEAVGEAEGGEQLRVEEVVVPDDPVA